MANAGDRISLNESISPNSKYLLEGTGRGVDSARIISGAATRGLVGGPEHQYELNKNAGGSEFRITGSREKRSWATAPRGFSAGQGRKM